MPLAVCSTQLIKQVLFASEFVTFLATNEPLNKGLILLDFAVNACNIVMEQKWIPQVCTALENHAFCVDSCDFFAFNSNTVCSMWYVTFFAFVHIGEWP